MKYQQPPNAAIKIHLRFIAVVITAFIMQLCRGDITSAAERILFTQPTLSAADVDNVVTAYSMDYAQSGRDSKGRFGSHFNMGKAKVRGGSYGAERFSVTYFNMGTTKVSVDSYDAGRFTGLWVGNPGLYQRGPVNLNYFPSPLVQVYQDQIGIFLHTYGYHPYSTLVTAVPGCSLPFPQYDIRPFSDLRNEVGGSLYMKMPLWGAFGKAAVYVAAYFGFVDTTSDPNHPVVIAYGVNLADIRGVGGDYIGYDPVARQEIIIATSLGPRAKWLHMGPNSYPTQHAPFKDFRYFDFRINSSEFKAALQAIRDKYGPYLSTHDIPGYEQYKHMSSDVKDYRLVYILLNPEVSDPDDKKHFKKSYGALGLTLKNLTLKLYTP